MFKSSKKIKYNYLNVPRGGQFSIKLSDSTIVWLNSESKLKYPIEFINGQPRQVELLYGEAYFEESRAMEQIKESPLADLKTVLTWMEHESPYKQVMKGLKDRGLSSGTIGIEEQVRFVFSNGIDKASAGTLKVVSATPVTAGCRAVKDEHEIELMKLASAVAHERLGFKGYASVQVGKWAALPHGSRTPQKIEEDQVILIDGGCRVEGYWSDLSRTFVLGNPAEKVKEAFRIDLEAQTVAFKTAKPGIQAQEVDAAARKVIVDAGYGPDYKYFTHRLGHGIGLDMHEWPYLVKGNTTILKPGHTFSNEPGIYVPGEFGVRLEDDIVITDNGAEFLSPQSPSLEDPFGPAPSL